MIGKANLNADHTADSMAQENADEGESAFDSRDLTPADLAELAPEVEAVQSIVWEETTDRDADRTTLQQQDFGNGLSSDRDAAQALVRLSEVASEETTPIPDQNVVEDLAVSAGIAMADKHPLHTNDMLEQRDSHRWELEPESAEDYPERS